MIDNIQIAEDYGSKHQNNKLSDNIGRNFSPLHKERELPKPSSFSEKKGEKKASLLPSSNFL